MLFAGLEGKPGALAAGELRGLEDTLGQAIDLSGGRIVNRREGVLMALFATADAAAAAAMRLHAYAQTMARDQGGLAIRIGFHSGPVVQRGEDICGDTVDLALQLVDKAKNGQIVTSQSTATSLSPAVQERVRLIGHLQARGVAEPVPLGELVWRPGPHHEVPPIIPAPAARRATLGLQYRKTLIVRRREGDVITLGREDANDIVLTGAAASRRHCTIERRNARFLLTDHSTNGTFIAPEKQEESAVRSATVPLAGRGAIGIGLPCAIASDVVTYASE
ncbi:MAG TPA: FHA domain-containing protein [Burkholderiales bacterium]|nr:FHA domain-containing protein [Burkholderiales bacterium]